MIPSPAPITAAPCSNHRRAYGAYVLRVGDYDGIILLIKVNHNFWKISIEKFSQLGDMI